MAIEESKRETGGKEEVSACVLCPLGSLPPSLLPVVRGDCLIK